MPKSHFQVEKATRLASIPAGSKIHFIGVCGTAMGQLAMLLAEQGYSVSGSDKEFYEPMGGLLRASSVDVCEGYSAAHIKGDEALVVIGNAISYGHPEVEEVEKKGLPYSFFPQLLQEAVIAGRHSIVITGTHGKSTTTALAISAFCSQNLDPSYFVGAAVSGLEKSLHQGSDAFSVVEGDEYDSAFFAKVPKFVFYQPDTLVVNAIEFDHADIYRDENHVAEQFANLVKTVPEGGSVIYCGDHRRVRSEYESAWEKKKGVRFLSFGEAEQNDIRLVQRFSKQQGQEVTVESNEFGAGSFSLPLLGRYNAYNAVAALTAVACATGLSFERCAGSFEKFSGVVRRQQVRFDNKSYTVIEDFAHHPSAIQAALAGLREGYPERRLLVAFEPRSNTSRRSVFREKYPESFRSADKVWLKEVAPKHEGEDVLDVRSLVKALQQQSISAFSSDDTKDIHRSILEKIEPNDIVVVMSNGSFDGLVDRLVKSLA